MSSITSPIWENRLKELENHQTENSNNVLNRSVMGSLEAEPTQEHYYIMLERLGLSLNLLDSDDLSTWYQRNRSFCEIEDAQNGFDSVVRALQEKKELTQEQIDTWKTAKELTQFIVNQFCKSPKNSPKHAS